MQKKIQLKFSKSNAIIYDYDILFECFFLDLTLHFKNGLFFSKMNEFTVLSDFKTGGNEKNH